MAARHKHMRELRRTRDNRQCRHSRFYLDQKSQGSAERIGESLVGTGRIPIEETAFPRQWRCRAVALHATERTTAVSGANVDA